MYTIESAIDNIDFYIDEETGEVIDSTINYLENLDLERKEKALSIAKKIDSMKYEMEAIKDKSRNLSKRAKAIENTINRLKGYLELIVHQNEKIKDDEIIISWRKSNKILISCETNELPEQFVKVTLDPKKAELKKALAEGEVIKGVEIIQNNNINIR